MKTNRKTIQSAMDNRLSFLDERPSCRAAVQYRIAQEEEPVMKKKVSVGFVFAMILVLLAAAALATGLLLSPRADAARTADRALEAKYGITAEMMTFFGREQEVLEDGTVRVTYTGAGDMDYAVGTYTAVVKDGKAEISWSHDGEDTSGGYASEAWGLDQLKQMLEDCMDEKRKQAYLDRAAEIAEAHGLTDESRQAQAEAAEETAEQYYERREADKTAAMEARKIPVDEMVATGREFIISNYGLNEEQVSRMELYTSTEEAGDNSWYEMIGGKPCFKVEYLLYQPLTVGQMVNGEPRAHEQKDGYYNVFVNVETGEIEEFEYNSGLGGQG